MLMSIAAWPSIGNHPAISLPPGLVDQPGRTNNGRYRNRHDHDRPADELGQRELPGEQQGQDDASSMTRLVLAISNAIAAVKLAPLRSSARASATTAAGAGRRASPVATASGAGQCRRSAGHGLPPDHRLDHRQTA
jgi:hypothetical protein